MEALVPIGKWVLTLPTKIVAAPLLNGASPSWDNMLRRTDVLFRPDSDFQPLARGQHCFPDEMSDDKGEAPQTGALTCFLEALRQEIRAHPEITWDITLVGHSMGTIVLNHVLRDFGDELPISHIVYMGAACSIRDYEDSVWTYLRRRKRYVGDQQEKCITAVTQSCAKQFAQSPQCQQVAEDSCKPQEPPTFYNLMLHPKAEARDTSPVFHEFLPYLERIDRWIDLAPRGSLLVWLDAFLTNPETPLDHTLGRFTNFMEAAGRTPGNLAPWIRPAVFPMNGQHCSSQDKEHSCTYPEHHRDFSAYFKFWKAECWQLPDNPEEPQAGYTTERCWYENEAD